MNTNKITIIGTIIVCIIIISIPTTIKVLKSHNERLYKVSNERIINAYKKCYYDDLCEEKATLKDLYEKGYLKELEINPVSKEVYNEESIIEKHDNLFIFNPLE